LPESLRRWDFQAKSVLLVTVSAAMQVLCWQGLIEATPSFGWPGPKPFCGLILFPGLRNLGAKEVFDLYSSGFLVESSHPCIVR
jgi:hypothetical protein